MVDDRWQHRADAGSCIAHDAKQQLSINIEPIVCVSFCSMVFLATCQCVDLASGAGHRRRLPGVGRCDGVRLDPGRKVQHLARLPVVRQQRHDRVVRQPRSR